MLTLSGLLDDALLTRTKQAAAAVCYVGSRKKKLFGAGRATDRIDRGLHAALWTLYKKQLRGGSKPVKGVYFVTPCFFSFLRSSDQSLRLEQSPTFSSPLSLSLRTLLRTLLWPPVCVDGDEFTLSEPLRRRKTECLSGPAGC